jgi:hypothetical protein
MAMTQVVSVRTTGPEAAGSAVCHSHLVALIPAISMLAWATTRII